MSIPRLEIRVRCSTPSDAAPLCKILNAIIQIGGTTALEAPLSLDEFSGYFLKGERFLSCFVAEDSVTSRQLGFQGLSLHPELPEGWADSGTFTRSEFKTGGVRWPPKTGQAAKRESSLETAGWPEVRLVEYTEEAQS